MTEVLDPLRAAARIKDDYLRYLRSTFSPRDPVLRADVERQLAEDLDLTKGPILQAMAPYATGASVSHLIDEGVLHPRLRGLAASGFGIDRPLYVHQEQAIRKARAGRNLIVATGTGSGKTESFLLPILDSLVREIEDGTADQPGVRALLLYPMNALANDQLARLRDLFGPFPELTFGRYVGDTPAEREQGLAQFAKRFGGTPPENELVSRDEMKARPPHVLLTNFAMLEYLLLRPEEQRFFDGPTGSHWRHVVLDEIHVYDGAKGAEIGMLLRRVRERVLASERGRLRCVGTSATLGRGREDLPRLREFAEAIFDESFEYDEGHPDRQDVVEATRSPLRHESASWFLPEDRIAEVRDRFRAGGTVSEVVAACGEAGAPEPAPGESAGRWLGRVLASETHVVALQNLLHDGSVDIHRAAESIIEGGDRAERLAALVDVCVGAEVAGTGRPLIPARWHFLLRSLEGAYSCLDPQHPEGRPRVLLSRHRNCPGCAEQRRTSTMFEMGVCRRCGARYIVGEEQTVEGRVVLAPPRIVAENPRTFLVVGNHLAEDEADDEDEQALGEQADDEFDPAVICTSCGTLGKQQVGCGCGAPIAPLREVRPKEPGKPVRRCAACGGRTSGGSIVLRFLTGSDAPVAVIATSLYQEIPAFDRARGVVGDGRKLLSFADSRQDAAFFAAYLERTYNRAVQRRLLWQVIADELEDGRDVLRIADLRTELASRAVDLGLIDEDDPETPPDQHARHWLYAELLSMDRQQNLEGVGLAEVAVPVPRNLEAPPPLLDLGLDEDEVFDLVRVLLDTARRGGAITVDSKVDLKNPIFGGRPNSAIKGEGSSSRVLSWNPVRGTNQRVRYLEKVLRRLERDVDAKELLAQIWREWLAQSDGPWKEVLILEEDRGDYVYRLKSERLEFRPVTDTHRPLQCDTCRQVWWRAVRGACPGVNCEGTVSEHSEPGERDHYRALYTSLTPIGMRVEEHTAQLNTDLAAERQQDFLDGKINLLSCSTTFELGVDVGEIQSVLMRNVPPSAANYVQRAGRAGRRAGSPALVVTFAQRRSHDLHFFDHPESMIDGHVAAPVVKADNPAIIRRHLNAMAFAEFQKEEYRRLGNPDQTNHQVVDFFLPEASSPSDRFLAWLRSEPPPFGARVRSVVPAEVALDPQLGLDHWGWLDGLDGDPSEEGKGRLRVAASDIRRDLRDLEAAIDAAYEQRNRKHAGVLEKVKATVSSVRTLDRLARAGVLPKYGFPVDVVTLELRNENRVELDRDLAIAITDFAPGTELVADKRLWRSVGLRVQAGLTLVAYRWAECSACHTRWTFLDAIESTPPCPSCNSEQESRGRRVIQPRFGFVGEDSGRRPGESRPAKTAFSSWFFDDYVGAEPGRTEEQIGRHAVEVKVSRSGRITVINQGPGAGYDICQWCGFVRSPGTSPEEDHARPLGYGRCSGHTVTAGLFHSYLTDTVEIRPHRSFSQEEMLSTLQALLAATEDVGIAHADMNGAIHPAGRSVWSFVLFDAVPGGAGHARRLAQCLPDLFTAARARVDRCDCGEDTSCYGCLRSYRNQRDHDRLERRLALQVFDAMGVT